MEVIYQFVLGHMRPIELFVFWYPVVMGMLWVIGGIIYYFRIERKDPLPLISTPFVTVVVPAYNESENIRNTVEKLSHLNYPEYEILIINDGSKDETSKIVSELSETNPLVRFVDLRENCGKANALYLAFLAAKGEFLVCVDGDSYLDPDCLRYMIPHFTNPHNGERVGAVTGNPRVRNRSSLLSKIQICEYASIISLIKRTQRIWGKVMTVSGVVVAYRKKALLDCGLWDRDMITEDIGVTWKLERKFWDIRYEPRAICWMLVPETLKGLFRQRKRWAQGGQEVMFRHANIFKSWRRRRLIPIFLEQVCSLTWVLAWLLLTVTEIFKLCYHADSYIPYLWKSQFLSMICMVQFAAALCMEHKYDTKIFKNAISVAWYPLFYWMLTGLVSLFALPASLKKKKALAVWTSPDRGIKAEQTSEEPVVKESAEQRTIPDAATVRASEQTAASVTQTEESGKEENIISGKQKWWKKIIEGLITVFAWCYILVYVGYLGYGLFCKCAGIAPKSFFIYNSGVLSETVHLLLITGIIILVETVLLVTWKTYNKLRFGKKNRRTFKPDVTTLDTAFAFQMKEETIRYFQSAKRLVLEKNPIPKDFHLQTSKEQKKSA